MNEPTKEDLRRLEGVWHRVKVIGGVNGYPELAIGFNEDEDPVLVMAAIGRIALMWRKRHQPS